MSRSQRRGGFGLLLLGSQIMSIGADRIPPVTLFTVILNTVIYMRLWPGLPSVGAACSSNNLVFANKEWTRLIFSSFFHLDDMHLYYNMVSFIWKGMTLERKLGKRKFIILLAVFSIATQLTMLGLNKFFAIVFFNKHYLRTCAAGFSAVIFALKVLTTASSNGSEQIMGLPILVPSRYVCWVELVVIQLLVPNASFTGHLAGILVGLMYIYGPLKWFVKTLSKLSKGEGIPLPRRQHTYNHQRATSGYGQPRNAQARTLDEEDEDLQRVIRESLRDHQQRPFQSPGYGWNVPNQNNTRPYPRSPSSSRNNIYPDLNEQTRMQTVPSAPPEPTPIHNTRSHNPDLPYPPDDDWASSELPYPRGDNILPSAGIHTPQDNIRTTNNNTDELRRARLRRFNQS